MDDYNAYVTAVNKIFDYVAKLKAGWSSNDHFAYIEKIEELKSAVTGCANEYKKPAAAVPVEEETQPEEPAERPAEPELQFPQPAEPAPQPQVPQGDSTSQGSAQQMHNGPVVLPSVGPTPNPQGAAPIPMNVPTVSLPQQSPAPKPTSLAKLDSGSIPTLGGGN